MDKLWKLAKQIDETFKNQFPEINPIILQLLSDRGLKTQKAIDEFLNPDYGTDLHDPFLFLGMQKAVDRIYQAIINKEPVLVYGDYDTDGVCSSVLMVSLLQTFGLTPEIYIPDREIEGYGLNKTIVSEIIKQGVKLVITVDCGVTNSDEIELLNQNNIDVIITDHHQQVGQLPKALAIIDPKIDNQTYPFSELSGCGVAFKVAQAVLSEQERLKHPNLKYPSIGFEKWLLDLVAVATVADICPLLGENRTLVKYGLVVLGKTRRPGFLALAQISGTQLQNINTHVIGFQISPRLNAAGRIDHASTAYELLMSEDFNEALNIARGLDEKNQKRQKITEQIHELAKKQIGEVANQKILFAHGENWQTGIIGLVAGKLTDEFFRPTLVTGKTEDGRIVGSGRSIAGFNITEALEKCQDYLLRYGGHSQACGFTIEESKLPDFKKAMIELAEKKLSEENLKPLLNIDVELPLMEVDWQLNEELEKFEPFGQGNEKPLFLTRNLKVVGFQSVGKDNQHLRIMVADENGNIRKTIGFCFGDWCQKLKVGDRVDLVFEVDVNVWNGNKELQLKIVDIKTSQ
jgi:single-stranded-DNA-specific exonuclease